VHRAASGGWAAFVLALAVSPAAKSADPAPAIRLGLVQTMFRDVPPSFVQSIQGPFRDVFKRQTGMVGEIELLPDWEALSNRIKDGTLSAGVLHGFEFAWAKKANPDLEPIVVSKPHEAKLTACIVVNAAGGQRNITNPGDLTGPCVVVSKGLKAHVHLYYENLRKGYPATTLQPAGPAKGTTEDAITAVLTGDAEAALVDYAAIKNYQALRPGAGKNIKILCESESFPVSVLAVKKGVVAPGTLTQIRDGLTQAHKSAEGKMLMMLWNLKGFAEVPKDYDDQLDKIAKAYPPPAKIGPTVATKVEK
jgi:ABC-type phosphate/phosphonate transport system substrate-binding protein